jgi:hypothetical protein
LTSKAMWNCAHSGTIFQQRTCSNNCWRKKQVCSALLERANWLQRRCSVWNLAKGRTLCTDVRHMMPASTLNVLSITTPTKTIKLMPCSMNVHKRPLLEDVSKFHLPALVKLCTVFWT